MYTESQLTDILTSLINLPAETEIVEFKKAENSFSDNDLGEYFSALSNEANLKGATQAWLVFGVDNNSHKVLGTNYKPSRPSLDEMKKKIADQTTNRITFDEIYEVNYNTKRVILFQIPAAPQGLPIAYKGHYYGRDNESLVALNLHEIELIRAQAKQKKDWTADIIPEATIDWLDKDAIKKARKGYKQRHSDQDAETIDSWSDAVFLDKAKITIDQKITKTALLLLGKEEYQPYLGHIAQIVWKLNTGDELAGDIFTIPFLTATQKVLDKIRNYRFKIYPRNSMIPMEVWKYDTKSILEGLHNCIAHQDYEQNARVIVTERKDELVFTSTGNFFAGRYEDYIEGEKTPDKYRNPFLVQAMVNVKMIDTQGFGIHNMFESQKGRFLPMPDYDFSNADKVELHMPGTVIDENYSLILIERSSSINLTETYLLDKVQKRHQISSTAVDLLRQKHLVEGRKPNVYVSKQVANITGQKAEYTRNKGFNDQYYCDLLIMALKQHKTLKRKDIDALLLDKLPEAYDEKQKVNKIDYLLKKLKVAKSIKYENGNWVLL